MPPPAPAPPGNPSVKSRIVWSTTLLLVASVVINYVDRGNLSIAAPVLKTSSSSSRPGSSASQLLSAFFWTYASCQLVAGWLVERYDANWILAAGFFLWSSATAATGLVWGFGSLLLLRLLVGVAESVAYPAYSKIFSTHFEENHRGIANALIDAGSKIGPALGSLAGGFLIARFGWRPFFITSSGWARCPGSPAGSNGGRAARAYWRPPSRRNGPSSGRSCATRRRG